MASAKSAKEPTARETNDRDKALDTALAQIERQFGKGSIMKLGQEDRVPVEAIPTGSIALDIALGIGGLPRGRVVEIYGPESSGKPRLHSTRSQTARHLVASQLSLMLSMPLIQSMQRSLV